MAVESVKDAVQGGIMSMHFAIQETGKAGDILRSDLFGGMEDCKEQARVETLQVQGTFRKLQQALGSLSTLLEDSAGYGRTEEQLTFQANRHLGVAQRHVRETRDSLPLAMEPEVIDDLLAPSFATLNAAQDAMAARVDVAARYVNDFSEVRTESEAIRDSLGIIGERIAALLPKIGAIGDAPDGSAEHSEQQAATDAVEEARTTTGQARRELVSKLLRYKEL